MPSLPESIINLLSVFESMFSRRVWSHVQVLLTGAIVCQGERTIASVLRVMGLAEDKGFCRYHRVLNRAKWSGLQGSRILLGLLVELVSGLGIELLIVVDETLERRRGGKISKKGKYRDAVRSTHKAVVTCWGLKWICFAVLVPLPWSKRYWALPFLSLLAPPAAANHAAGRSHKTTVAWTILAVKLMSRWLAGRRWTLVGDGGYASVALAHACRACSVRLVSRLRLDVRLFDVPTPQPKGKRGRKPKKGERLTKLSELAADPQQPWEEVEVNWYGGCVKTRKILSGVCLWHTNGQDPVTIRWVVVIDPNGKDRPEAFFSTEEDTPAVTIVEIFVKRWSIEVTFEEVRRHLGVETQRQWSDLAIARTTPVLMALFSLVCLMVLHLLQDNALPLRHSAWYAKQQAAFSDVLAYLRRSIWAAKYFNNSHPELQSFQLSRHDMNAILQRLVGVT